MQRQRLFGGMLVAAAVLAVSATTVSTASAAPAAVTTTTTTLPLFGVPLAVEVQAGPGGVLTSVAVNPATGLTATTVKPNKVAFVNDAGTAKVVVRGRDGGQRVEVKAGALADVSGAGGWSGDVFGTGTNTTVGFTVGATATGGPDITGVTSSDATAVISATEYKNDDQEQHSAASARVTFTSGAQSRSLRIMAVVRTNEDGTTGAKVSVTLGPLRGVVQPVDVAIGVKTWSGALCNGDPASVTYTVNADGSLTNASATPDTATVSGDGNKVNVKFASGERLRIESHTSTDGIKVDVREKFRCKGAADPTVNTPVSTIPGNDHAGDHPHGDHPRGGDSGGDHRGDHRGDPTGTAAPSTTASGSAG
jgi:hypothetical protein